jgi:hypothetical protein
MAGGEGPHGGTAHARGCDPRVLVDRVGGSHAASLGIDLSRLQPAEIYKWFLAAVLYGAPIPAATATRTWRAFEHGGMLAPADMIAAGWDALVAILDRGGYVRYDYKTASKLLEVNRALLADYDGDLNALHAAAADAADLEARIMALGKGIGRVTAGIFLRELRGRWAKADPPLSPLALAAARELGCLPPGDGDERDARVRLQRLWREHGMSADSFVDFEAALVREGLQRRASSRHDAHP